MLTESTHKLPPAHAGWNDYQSRQNVYGAFYSASVQREEARREADKLACEAVEQTNARFPWAAAAVPNVGDALNAVYSYLEVRCLSAAIPIGPWRSISSGGRS